MSNNPINSLMYLGDKKITSAIPLYLQDKLISKIYLGDKVVYRIIKAKNK